MVDNFIAHRGTFMRVPPAVEPNRSAAVILGVPFDCANHPVRVGSRLGPASIREQSLGLRAYDGESGTDPLTELNVVDLGDVEVIDGDIEGSYERIEQAMLHAQKNGAVPVVFGGDGSIALPQMRALAKKHPDLCVLHLDAHTDAYPLEGYDNSTPFSRAVEEGLISPEHSFHIGMRRSHLVPGVYQYGKSLGYHLIPMRELLERGFPAVFSEVRRVIGSRPVYLCFDMDVFDPSVAPGVCTPAAGGLTTREGLEILELLEGLNIVSIDINTISPPHDVGGVSAFLAATVAYELLAMLANKKIGSAISTKG